MLGKQGSVPAQHHQEDFQPCARRVFQVCCVLWVRNVLSRRNDLITLSPATQPRLVKEGTGGRGGVCCSTLRSDLSARTNNNLLLTGRTCARLSIPVLAWSSSVGFAWSGCVIPRDVGSAWQKGLQTTASPVPGQGDQLCLFPGPCSWNAEGRFVPCASRWVYSPALKCSQDNP